MKVFAFLPIAAAFQVMDTHTNMGVDVSYDGLKSTLKSIANHQAANGGKIDPDTINTVTNILADINSQLLTALAADTNHSQTILNIAHAAVVQCDTDKGNWIAGGHATKNAGVTGDKGAHETCRGEENTECQNATNVCNTHKTRVCGWSHCPVPTGFVNGDSDSIFEYMCCLETFFNNNRDHYYVERTNCIDATNVWQSKAAACDALQETFEVNYCTREQDVQTNCNTYRTCRDTEETDWYAIKAQTEDMLAIYRAQREALACLQCYGNKILSNTSDLSDCEELTPCDRLEPCPSIDFPPLPDWIPCTEPLFPNQPCDDATFITENYGQYDNTCTPPKQCTACHVTNDEGAFTESNPTYPA